MISAGINILIYAGIALGAANMAGDPNQAVTRDSVSIRQQVERQRMAAMEPNQPSLQTHALKEIVSQLQTLQAAKGSGSAAGAAEKTKGEKNKPASSLAIQVTPTTEPSKKPGTEPAPTLEAIEKPVNAMATADALYRAKDYPNAVRFYRMAVQHAGQADPAGCQWALYQMGNCLRSVDVPKAVEAYQQLIKEYPSSTWASAALIQQRNLEWLQQNQPVISKAKTLNDPNQ